MKDVMAGELIIAGTSMPVHATEPVINPYTGQTVAMAPVGDAEHMEAAIAAAVSAFTVLRRYPAHRRAALLSAISSGIAAHRAELADLIVEESGKPVTLALAEVDRAVTTFAIGAEEAKQMGGAVIPADRVPSGEGFTALTRRFPIGPIAAISPFNFPINLVAHKLAPALAVGCPVVLKPPVQTPLTPLRLARIVEEAGAPPGAFSVVPCPIQVGQKLVADPRMAMLSFTGSPKVGWYLKGLAGKKRATLELGGNAAAVVCEDADIEHAARRIAFGAFSYAGQICISVQRVFVQRSVYDAFLAALVNATQALGVGNPTDPKTIVGPLIDAAAADRVMAWIGEALAQGARLATGGTREGNVIRPAILTNTAPDLKVSCEEVFGPVVTVTPFDAFEDALAQVNDGRFGLQTGVFTHDIRRALLAYETLEVGGVIVGDIPTTRLDHTPYGGCKDSGLGREGVRYAMEEMTDVRLLLIKH